MRRIGPVILASAATVIIAFLCLSVSRFGMTRTSGWVLAIGIAVTLAAGLTLVPGLMALFGRYLFWPNMAAPVHERRTFGWANIGRWVADHPAVAAVSIVVILALPYTALPNLSLSANVLTQIPQNVESAHGLNVVREHFPMGEATVLFNFGATLGITTWLFLDVLNGESLIYLLPMFVFVMLAAVGADYNIFLVSRIREEAEQKSMKEAVQRAVAKTGGVITSCSIILAGTFATLATSSLPMVLQIGAPIAIGVLVDTFLVRALLVPSLAALSGRWSWWPSGLFRKARIGSG